MNQEASVSESSAAATIDTNGYYSKQGLQQHGCIFWTYLSSFTSYTNTFWMEGEKSIQDRTKSQHIFLFFFFSFSFLFYLYEDSTIMKNIKYKKY